MNVCMYMVNVLRWCWQFFDIVEGRNIIEYYLLQSVSCILGFLLGLCV